MSVYRLESPHTTHLISQGIYGVSVDDGPVQYYSGYSSTDQFQQVLYATWGLTDGEHQIKLSNDNARNVGQFPDYIWFDVDHVAVTGNLYVEPPSPRSK